METIIAFGFTEAKVETGLDVKTVGLRKWDNYILDGETSYN